MGGLMMSLVFVLLFFCCFLRRMRRKKNKEMNTRAMSPHPHATSMEDHE